MKKLYLLLTFLFLLSACGGGGQAQEQTDYDKTKNMVVDILQTEEGKSALRELMQDEKLKQELVIQSDVVKAAINETLLSEEGQDMWKTLFADPSFVQGYTDAIAEEQTNWLKSLMADAEYQKQLLEILQNPEMTTLILSTLKSQQFRAHLEETIQQTLTTPLFQAKIQEILLKAAEEQAKQSESGGGSGENGGGDAQSEGEEESGGGSGN